MNLNNNAYKDIVAPKPILNNSWYPSMLPKNKFYTNINTPKTSCLRACLADHILTLQTSMRK